jgi:mannan endo-1,4-beta-mannosidase
MNIPQIGFGSFQLFPDQNIYGPDDPNLSAFNNTVETGIEWIQRQANMSQLYDHPSSLAKIDMYVALENPSPSLGSG